MARGGGVHRPALILHCAHPSASRVDATQHRLYSREPAAVREDGDTLQCMLVPLLRATWCQRTRPESPRLRYCRQLCPIARHARSCPWGQTRQWEPFWMWLLLCVFRWGKEGKRSRWGYIINRPPSPPTLRARTFLANHLGWRLGSVLRVSCCPTQGGRRLSPNTFGWRQVEAATTDRYRWSVRTTISQSGASKPSRAERRRLESCTARDRHASWPLWRWTGGVESRSLVFLCHVAPARDVATFQTALLSPPLPGWRASACPTS